MIEISRKILSFMDERARVQLLLLLVPMLITTILEIASIGMILPLMDVFLNGGKNKLFAWLPNLPINEMTPDRQLLVAMSFFAAFFIIKNLAIIAMTYAINLFTLRKLAIFQQRMFDLYLRRSYTFHFDRNSAEILRNLIQSSSIAFDGLRLGLNLILEGLLAAAALILLLIIEPEITIGIGLLLLILSLLFLRIMSPIVQRWGERVHKVESKMIQSINQSFGAIKVVKVLNCYSYLNRVFSNQTNEWALDQSRNITSQNLPRVYIESVVVLGFLAAVIVLHEMHDSIQDVLSVLGLFGMASLRLMPSLNRILTNVTSLKNRTAPVDSLYEDLQSGIQDTKTSEYPEKVPNLEFTREIRLENLSFNYTSAKEKNSALKSVNLTITKGESVGVIGPSGAGKTTLIDIIMCLLHPSEGHLLIDGIAANECPRAWQRHLGYVPQHIYLLDDSLRRNIAFGVADKDIDEKRIATTLQIAHLDKVIADLPDGLDTKIGEVGIRLSGGQRQRIGIARALYHDPDVLLFDEATSALDSETERDVTLAIEELSTNKTLIIIAHRLSTVRKCDTLIFMRNGMITDTGSFDELMKSNPDFSKMVELGNLTSSKESVPEALSKGEQI